MIDKFTSFLISREDITFINDELIKTAELKLPDGITYDPDFFYMKVRAVSAGEYYGCFPEGNKVLMGDGSYKDIKDVVEGDFIITHNGNNKKVLKKFTKKYEGDIYKITPYKVNSFLTCTEEHPILSITKENIVCNHDKYIKCLPQFIGKRNICNRKYTHCDQDIQKFEENFISANKLKNNDFIAYRYFKPKDTTKFSPEEMYFVGLYLAEGSISQISLNVKEIRLSFGLHEKNTLVKYFLENIAPILNFYKLGGPYDCKEKGQTQITINDPVWVERLLKYCGKLSDQKFISPELKCGQNINYLLQGYIDGDGHIDCTERVTMTTVSQKLGRDLFDVVIQCGYNPSYGFHKYNDENHKDRQQITFSMNNKLLCNFGIKRQNRKLLQDKAHSFIYNEKFYSKLKNIDINNFKGLVYNLEIEDDNSYIVNGICVHNCNKNADFFPEKELKENYKTFMSAHTFKNHENKDVANAIGDVLSAEWDDKMKSIVLLLRIDKKIAPSIVRGFEKGFMTDVSMGCRIQYSICSICGNKAKVKSEYCEHINHMRRKIFPDGKKVYEINIGPKFHDISAVLNGAEKVAKVTGIMITGNKVAFNMDMINSFEKVASIQESFEKITPEEILSIAKTAQELIDNSIEIPFEKTASKNRNHLQKIAEIKKEIQGRIVNIAKGEVIQERFEKAEELRKILKLLYTKYWDEKKCSEIADKIINIANQKRIPVECAFNQFLKVLDFAGIELSPLEFKNIYNKLIGETSLEVPGNFSKNIIDLSDQSVIDNDMGEMINFPTMFSTIKGMLPFSDTLADKIVGDRPVPKIKAIIIKIKRHVPSMDNDIAYDDMMGFVKNLMPGRSLHRRFLIKRAMDLSEEFDNTNHFAPSVFDTSSVDSNSIKNILPMMLYSKYQGDRVRRLDSPEMDYGLSKFASYIEGDSMENMFNEIITEKTAGSKLKYLGYSLPLTFGYSALQRSRIKNKENVSGMNRYIAENPANAYVIQALLGPLALKKLKSAGKNITNKAYNVSSKYFAKEASENIEDSIMSYGNDIFKNASIENELAKKYTKDQISALKYTHVFSEMYIDNTDNINNMLSIHKLSSDDLEEYLKISKDNIKIEFNKQLEKNASIVTDTIGTAAADLMFKPKSTSLLAKAPGALVDSLAITYLINKLSKGSNKKDAVKNIKNNVKQQ